MISAPVRVINPNAPEKSILDEAAAAIRAGGLVAFPTETVYGLGADALNSRAVARIFAAKGRPSNNPLIVHIANLAGVHRIAAGWPAAAQGVAERFWPGPLTIVLPKHPFIPDLVTAGGPTVAVRMPNHPVALGLLRAAGVPLAAPSANRSGQLSPTTAEHVQRGLGDSVDFILDAGPTRIGLESTVLDLSVSPPRLLRPGHITPPEIEAVIGAIARQESSVSGDKALLSPGMLQRHYSPQTPLECLSASHRRVAELVKSRQRVGWLTHSDSPQAVGKKDVDVVIMPREPRAYAARLYAELHQLDQRRLDRIIVEMPAETDDWLAVRDRLKRASQNE